MVRYRSDLSRVACMFLVLVTVAWGAEGGPDRYGEALNRLDIRRDICAVLGMPPQEVRPALLQFILDRELTVYFQSPDTDETSALRHNAERKGLLGTRVFVEEGAWARIGLADNLAGLVLVSEQAQGEVSDEEVLRVVRPGGKVLTGFREITKVRPQGTDSWSHPHHGPDNNPQSTDQKARAPYLTQFLAEPLFCPMPEVSVAAGGRVFRAFGHIAHKANQNAMLNTLIGVNAYNGMILWQRKLQEGFMIHRNTMIATPDTLYMADADSCKMIDARTGEIKGSIVIPAGVADGPVWKWMAMEKGILYALIGGTEANIETKPSNRPGMGHWPWGMWQGHDYSDPKINFGYGRTFVAIDPSTGKILWQHTSEDYWDSRGVCMKDGKIYCYSPESHLACLDTEKRELLWENSNDDLLEAIGKHARAQHYVTGYATTAYMKCNDDYIFFAGPQREQLVVASAENGCLLWQKEGGNLQLVLREDGFYAAGPKGTGAKYAYESGEVLAQLPNRRACTRATGSIDSIFFRTPGGTVRVNTAANTAQHIAPMRPPCQDGVIISDGHLYWGPWMCGCQLSLYGHIALGPAGDFDFRPAVDDSRWEKGVGDITRVASFDVDAKDWTTYMGNNIRMPYRDVAIPRQVEKTWKIDASDTTLTAPVIAGDRVFVCDRKGVVQSFDENGHEVWKAFTGGAIYFPPVVVEGRLFVGSADGWVYALESTTGRRLWRFRVGPATRRIPVYGKLISTWPVSGGVVVHNGVVYAAAGIAHYDGTYVVALDATTGKVKWYNDTSGALSEKVNSGVSLQGSLWIEDDELRFTGGGVYQTARYDLDTGKCLNTPHEGLNSRFHTAFYAYFPEYGQYPPLHHGYDDGKLLKYDPSYDGARQGTLALMGPIRASTENEAKAARIADRLTDGRRKGPQRDTVWQKPGMRFKGFVVTPEVLLATGVAQEEGQLASSLMAIQIKTGQTLWRQPLSAPVVKGGLALDSHARIVATLENGEIVCLR